MKPGWKWAHAGDALVERVFREQRFSVVRFIEEPFQILALVSSPSRPRPSRSTNTASHCGNPASGRWFRDCGACPLVPVCRQLPTGMGTAPQWRRLGLVDAAGTRPVGGAWSAYSTAATAWPWRRRWRTRAIPWRIWCTTWPISMPATVSSGPEDRWGRRLAMACRAAYGGHSVPGYLEAEFRPLRRRRQHRSSGGSQGPAGPHPVH